MRLPRAFGTALWLAATVASTTMVWTATSIVAADVTDRPPSVVAHRDVLNELESGPFATIPRPGTTLKVNGPATTAAGPGSGPAGANGAARIPARTQQPGGAPAPFSPTTTTTATTPPAAPTARPTSPSTTQPAPRPTATYSTAGGVVRVACNGFFIQLTAAIPSNGYSVHVLAAGPGNVDVRFVRTGQELSVKAVCFGQPIRYYEQDPPRQAPGSP